MIRGRCIWDVSRIPDRDRTRLEFPDLIRFKGKWYCAFREAETHGNHPSGRGRIITSDDAKDWESAAVLDWDCGDVREPKLSITPEGDLMVNTSVYFVSREPREDGNYYQLDPLGTVLNLTDNDRESGVAQQSVTWLSSDGKNWSSAFACPTGVNGWRWDVTWHNGMGYSISQWGKDTAGTLFRTRDGKRWRVLAAAIFPDDHAGEGALAFGDDDTAYCLLRGNNRKKVFIGVSSAPYYQNWEWTCPHVDYGPDDGGPGPAEDVLGVGLGGPKLVRLEDGRLLGAGRALGPGRKDGHATLFLVDPKGPLLTFVAEFDGTTYPGVVEYEREIWVTYVDSRCHQDIWEVHLGKVQVPNTA